MHVSQISYHGKKKLKKGKKTNNNNNNNLKKYLKSEATEKNRQMGCWGKSR